MPVSVFVDAADRVRQIVFNGVVTNDDLLAAYQMLAGAEEHPAMDLIVDTTRVEAVEVATAALQNVAAARSRDEADGARAPARVAIVAPAPAVFGYARMYESYREATGGTARYLICRTMSEARGWLGLAGA